VRILYIHQFFATRDSHLGLIRSYEFSRRWISQGHAVTVITSSSRLPERFGERLFSRGDIDGIDVRSVRVAYANRMSYARRALAFALFVVGATWLALRAPRPDVILATTVFEVRDLWPEAAIQMGAIRRGGVPAALGRALERAAYRASSAVVALSPGMAEGVIASGVAPERVSVVPNSSDTDLFIPGPKDPGIVERFGLDGRFVVGYTGAVGPSNAVEAQLPAAARELQSRGADDVTFLVVGDGKSMPALREAVADLPNVVVAGSMAKHELPRVTRTCDVLLVLFADVPILAMNSPNKLFDALASGRPVIVNSPGWTKELVESSGAGLYVPAGDGGALAIAIEGLARDPEARERMGERARALAVSDFSRDELAARVLDVLERATHTAN
jgi:glycosyltransferase involved in cell wall biosynthesis